MARNNNIIKKNRDNRPKPITLTLPIIFANSVNRGQEYSDISAINALDHLNDQILPNINVSLKCFRSFVMDDAEKKGSIDVGYILEYNHDDNTMTVGIYNRYTDFAEKNKENLAVQLNVLAEDDALKKFVSFELVEVEND